uniref:Gonadotropin beta chain n=1 Tax=Solanum tuberosum TaxID=4113 RepID=M1C9P8_SOLTU
MAMALRVLLLLVLFFATVKAQLFTRGANRRLVQDIVLKVAKYLNNGDIALAPAPAPPPSPLDCGGTFGNREMCGKCYTEMTTHGNKTKCP